MTCWPTHTLYSFSPCAHSQFQLLRRYLSGDYNRDTLAELFDAYVRTTLTGYLGSACGQTCCCLM